MSETSAMTIYTRTLHSTIKISTIWTSI